MSYPLRKVTNYEYVGACRYTGYIAKSIRLYMECGHTSCRKASGGVPARSRCRDCYYERPPEPQDAVRTAQNKVVGHE